MKTTILNTVKKTLVLGIRYFDFLVYILNIGVFIILSLLMKQEVSLTALMILTIFWPLYSNYYLRTKLFTDKKRKLLIEKLTR